MTSLVIGATGKVGGYIVSHLVAVGEAPFAMSRRSSAIPAVNWIIGDLAGNFRVPAVDTIYCTANVILFAKALPAMITPKLKRVIVFTTTSVMTKLDSEIDEERKLYGQFVAAEREVQAICERTGIAWTILRPTLIYDEGKDRNVTRLARVIRKVRVMPVVGAAAGLRQPVHAEDLAIGAISAAHSPAAANKTYVLAGTETITYAEMIGRIFDGLGMRRTVLHIPAFLWRLAFAVVSPFFPGFNVAMGLRMNKNMIFDTAEAQRDLGWTPRSFRPKFR